MKKVSEINRVLGKSPEINREGEWNKNVFAKKNRPGTSINPESRVVAV